MSPTATSGGIVSFGVFEVDLQSGELYKQGHRVKLQPQPFEFLVILLEHPGELVTREEIRKRLWSSDTFVDFEHSLNTSVKKLREALGDDAETPRYVETLPRHGYRFIYPLDGARSATSEDSSAASLPAERGAEKPLPERGREHRLIAMAVVLALAGIAFALSLAGWRLHGLRSGEPRQGGSLPKVKSIAVLPLESLSTGSAGEQFADVMTAALITDLGKIGSLRVVSRTSVMQYKRTRKPLPQIARELRVDAVVEGTVVCSDHRVRVTANLLLAPTDRHLWSETYESDLGDILILQDEVAQEIANQIRLQLTPLK